MAGSHEVCNVKKHFERPARPEKCAAVIVRGHCFKVWIKRDLSFESIILHVCILAAWIFSLSLPR